MTIRGTRFVQNDDGQASCSNPQRNYPRETSGSRGAITPGCNAIPFELANRGRVADYESPDGLRDFQVLLRAAGQAHGFGCAADALASIRSGRRVALALLLPIATVTCTTAGRACRWAFARLNRGPAAWAGDGEQEC